MKKEYAFSKINLCMKFDLLKWEMKNNNATFLPLKKLKAMNYIAYLNTYHWRLVRILALYEKGHICFLCSDNNAKFHIHHKTYEHRGEEHNYLDDLIVLCADCHNSIHNEVLYE